MLLTRAPLYLGGCPPVLARLACVRHAASVRSEPGSNSPVKPGGTVDRRGRGARACDTRRPWSGRIRVVRTTRSGPFPQDMEKVRYYLVFKDRAGLQAGSRLYALTAGLSSEGPSEPPHGRQYRRTRPAVKPVAARRRSPPAAAGRPREGDAPRDGSESLPRRRCRPPAPPPGPRAAGPRSSTPRSRRP